MKKKQSSIIREAIIELADEDYYGLWEICWRVTGLLRIPEPDVIDAVRRELADLVEEHKIAFYLRTRLEEEPIPVAADRLDWHSAVTVRPPKAGEPQVLISVPDPAVPPPSGIATDLDQEPRHN